MASETIDRIRRMTLEIQALRKKADDLAATEEERAALKRERQDLLATMAKSGGGRKRIEEINARLKDLKPEVVRRSTILDTISDLEHVRRGLLAAVPLDGHPAEALQKRLRTLEKKTGERPDPEDPDGVMELFFPEVAPTKRRRKQDPTLEREIWTICDELSAKLSCPTS